MSDSIPEIDPAAAAAAVEAGALLLDVRTDDEWDAGRVPGAVLIPLAELPARFDELPSDRELMVICRSGGRSATATEALRGWGLPATNVAGGAQAWSAAGLPFDGEVA